MKTWFSQFGVIKLDWPAQSSDDCEPILVTNHTNALSAEWEQVPADETSGGCYSSSLCNFSGKERHQELKVSEHAVLLH